MSRYGRLQRVLKWSCSWFIFFLFQIVVLYYPYLRCLFTFHSPCLCVLALVCYHPTAHPHVLTPDRFFEDFLTRSKVTYNVKEVFLFFAAERIQARSAPSLKGLA